MPYYSTRRRDVTDAAAWKMAALRSDPGGKVQLPWAFPRSTDMIVAVFVSATLRRFRPVAPCFRSTFVMMALRPIIAFTVVCVLAGASSRAFAQGGMAGMDHSKHRMGPEIVIPKGALYTKADVEFMQGMIAHHAQAIVMSRMAEANGANPQVLKLSRKIDQSQVPEIIIMQEWLRRNGQFAPDTASWHDMRMDGMLTDDELKAMSEAKGVDFDRLFLDRHDQAPRRRASRWWTTSSSPRAPARKWMPMSSPTMSSRRRPPRSASCGACCRSSPRSETPPRPNPRSVSRCV